MRPLAPKVESVLPADVGETARAIGQGGECARVDEGETAMAIGQGRSAGGRDARDKSHGGESTCSEDERLYVCRFAEGM